MADIVYAYEPTIVTARVTTSFANAGLTDDKIETIVLISAGGFMVYDPTDDYNPVNGFEARKVYFIVTKELVDLTGVAYNTLPINYEPIPYTIPANTWFAGIAIDTVDFATMGLDNTKVSIVYKIELPYASYDPDDAYSAISGIVQGKCYLAYSLVDQDLSAYFSPVAIVGDIDVPTDDFEYYGTTDEVDGDGNYIKDYYKIPVRFFDDEASLPVTGIENIIYVAKGEGTSWYWDGAAYQPIGDGGGGGGTTDVLFFTDYTSFPGTGASDTIYVDESDGILYRWDGSSYIQIGGSEPTEFIPDHIVSGGVVTWQSGLTFNVTAAIYYIGGQIYASPETNITLDAADPSDPRFDLLVLTTSGTATDVTGTPASSPSEPQIDPATQLYLTAVLVEAGATTPTGVSTVIIYDENVEWTTSSAGTISVNFNSATSPSNGTKAAAVASWGSGAQITFANGSPIPTSDVVTIYLKIRLGAALSKNQNVSLQFVSGALAASQQITLPIDKSIVGSYQQVALSNISFLLATFDRVRLFFSGSTSNLIIDEVKYQKGVSNTGTEVDPTVPLLVKQIPVSTEASIVKYLWWDGSKYLRKQIAYSEISGTPSTTNWDAAYNDKINSAAFTGTTTKTLTLTQQDGGTVTANFTDNDTIYTDEQAQDAVGTILSSEFTYDDATPAISINAIAYSKITGGPTQYTDEMAMDAIAAMIAAGTHSGITFTYNDGANKIDVTATGTVPNLETVLGVGYTASLNSIVIFDHNITTVGTFTGRQAFLSAQGDVTSQNLGGKQATLRAEYLTAHRLFQYPDYPGILAAHPDITGEAGKVLAVNATEDGLEWITAGGGSSYTDEQAQDAIAAMFAAGTHSGISFTYNDGSNSIDATVSGGTVPNTLVVSQSTTATLAPTSKTFYKCDTSGGSIVLTLPTAVGKSGLELIFKKINSANTVTLDGAGTETIDGGTTAVLSTQYTSLSIISDGANWHII